jgi:hypothetical protein
MPLAPRRVHVVHGILDPVGKAGLLKLVPYLQQAGFDVRVPDYGVITAVETRIANPLIVRTLRPYVEPGDLYIGHSNGCAIGYDLITAGARPAGVVFINGALKRNIELPGATWADVYYNEGDDATVAAVAAARLGLSDPVWGDMGHVGYSGSNPNVTNIDCDSVARTLEGLPLVFGHSDIFTDGKVEAWAPYIVSRVLAHIKLP